MFGYGEGEVTGGRPATSGSVARGTSGRFGRDSPGRSDTELRNRNGNGQRSGHCRANISASFLRGAAGEGRAS